MKILLVEDSATVAAYVASILGSEGDMELLPVATNAEDAVRSALRERPDVVLMDMKLPDHDGLWAIERIMRDAPCPIVVLSGYLSSKERDITFESLRAGAVEVLGKPTGMTPEARSAFRQSLVHTVRLMSTAVVVRRTRPAQPAEAKAAPRVANTSGLDLQRIRYVLIGASTGGPELLSRMLGALPAPLPYPIVITQHTLEGFDESLAEWLSSTGHRVTVAREGDQITAGRVWIAPADRHIRIGPAGLLLTPAKKGESISSVDTMFDTAAKMWGELCLALLLTGMGRDGANGMRTLYERGALTVVQSPETCVVASMPESARAKGAARLVLSPEEMVAVLNHLTQLTQVRSQALDMGRGK